MSEQNQEVVQIQGMTSSVNMTPEQTYYGSAPEQFWAEVIPLDMQQSVEDTFEEDRDLKEWVIDPSELEIGEMIAEGGQGSVFLAVWKKPDATPVIVKRFKSYDALRLKRQLLNVMRLRLTDAQSQYLCKVLGVSEDENGVFIVMERMAGDLRNVIDHRMRITDAKMPFPYGSSLLLMYSISLGVLALHNNGILHRDLKAANILVVPNKDWMKSEEEGLVTAFEWCNLSIKIGDYERSEDAMGTGFWRAPEVLPGSADKRGWTREGDVYSFAMVCYEILTGRFPFEGELLSVYEPVLSGQRPELPAYVSKDMKKLLERCWDADPDKRPNFSVISSGIMYIFANEYGLELDKYHQECIRKYEDLQLQVHLDKISNAKSQLQRFQADMDILLKLSHMVRNF
ncbi:unnamed protein product [Sphagnum balticum]